MDLINYTTKKFKSEVTSCINIFASSILQIRQGVKIIFFFAPRKKYNFIILIKHFGIKYKIQNIIRNTKIFIFFFIIA